MSNTTGGLGDAARFSSVYTAGGGGGGGGGGEEVLLNQNHFNENSPNSLPSTSTHSSASPTHQDQNPVAPKKKRKQPGNPDPTSEVIALSPSTLMATNRFVCELCHKGFQREQNLQLHRRGHNLPWTLKAGTTTGRKKVYVCPEPACLHHDPARALGDLTGIKKHFCRKHGEKKWTCEKCSKKYAVLSDWKAHSKICGTKYYKCECGAHFSREADREAHALSECDLKSDKAPPTVKKDSYLNNIAFCDAQAKENQKAGNQTFMAKMVSENLMSSSLPIHNNNNGFENHPEMSKSSVLAQELMQNNPPNPLNNMQAAPGSMFSNSPAAAVGGLFGGAGTAGACADSSASMSATALLHKASWMANKSTSNIMTSVALAPSTFPMQPQIGIHGRFVNQLMMQQKPPHQEIPSQFLLVNPNGGHGHVQHHDNGGFHNFQLDIQNHAILNNYEHGNVNNTKSVLHGATNSDSSATAAGGATSYYLPTGDMTTVDYLGMGGSSRPRSGINLHDYHRRSLSAAALQQHHQAMKFNGGIGHPIMNAGFNQLHQQHEATMEKPMWEAHN